LHELAHSEEQSPIVRVTENGLEFFTPEPPRRAQAHAGQSASLIPDRPLEQGEQYRFHFNVTKCIGCRSCEVACNEQNGNPADIRWRRVGEIEGGIYPDTLRHYLSMGCNLCMDAECVKGCPVDAYTKDPVTGIVLHSADACIGCQYCVWNCPYSVPQFNQERGVVGKCDMCHGRLTDGLEPACVNACPENAIEIEIVNKEEWRADYALAESPGMPAAGITISTTRITLPEGLAVKLDRVDTETLRMEHAHWSLVFMTTFIQLAVGAFTAVFVSGHSGPIALTLLLGLTAVSLNISVTHLGRPAYAWRALKMWKRSWLSREVLGFGLFFVFLAGATGVAWAPAVAPLLSAHGYALGHVAAVHFLVFPPVVLGLNVLTIVGGFVGVVAGAYIYMVPARPAWNMIHTLLDFLLSTAMLGSAAAPLLLVAAQELRGLPGAQALDLPAFSASFPEWPIVAACALWFINQGVRLVRLNQSPLYEHGATASLLNSYGLRELFVASGALVGLTVVLALTGHDGFALGVALLAVLATRYLFFVSVVPLNMALTFVRSVHV
jgi:DMSO reductase iron-sulfur subunit